MYASYGSNSSSSTRSMGLKNHSCSTTDVFQVTRIDEHHHHHHQPSKVYSSYSTLGRSNNNNRAREAPPPPPRVIAAIRKTNKCSYLSDDIRREYEEKYEIADPVIEPQNCSFVRRLVATLEQRRQCNDAGGAGINNKAVNNSVAAAHQHQSDHHNQSPATMEKMYKPEYAPLPIRRVFPKYTGCPEAPAAVVFNNKLPVAANKQKLNAYDWSSKKWDEQLREDKMIEDSGSSSSSSSNNNRNSIGSSNSSEESDIWSSEASDAVPALPNRDYYLANGNHPEAPSLKRTARRALRKIGSLIGWRNSTALHPHHHHNNHRLPKGTRDYYATRESLSDELGSFRRNTLPQLIQQARPGSSDSTDQLRKDDFERHREFAELIAANDRHLGDWNDAGASVEEEEMQPVLRRANTATIHPIYGSNKMMMMPMIDSNLGMTKHLSSSSYSSSCSRDNNDNFKDSLYAPAVPIPIKSSMRQNSCFAPSSTLENEEHLLRPSRVREVEKRLSQQEVVQFRRPKAAAAALAAANANVIYDVPRSIRPVSTSSISSLSSVATTTLPIYENTELFALADQRLNPPTGFTTF